jgi:hypothetical protein
MSRNFTTCLEIYLERPYTNFKKSEEELNVNREEDSLRVFSTVEKMLRPRVLHNNNA